MTTEDVVKKLQFGLPIDELVGLENVEVLKFMIDAQIERDNLLPGNEEWAIASRKISVPSLLYIGNKLLTTEIKLRSDSGPFWSTFAFRTSYGPGQSFFPCPVSDGMAFTKHEEEEELSRHVDLFIDTLDGIKTLFVESIRITPDWQYRIEYSYSL